MFFEEIVPTYDEKILNFLTIFKFPEGRDFPISLHQLTQLLMS